MNEYYHVNISFRARNTVTAPPPIGSAITDTTLTTILTKIPTTTPATIPTTTLTPNTSRPPPPPPILKPAALSDQPLYIALIVAIVFIIFLLFLFIIICYFWRKRRMKSRCNFRRSGASQLFDDDNDIHLSQIEYLSNDSKPDIERLCCNEAADTDRIALASMHRFDSLNRLRTSSPKFEIKPSNESRDHHHLHNDDDNHNPNNNNSLVHFDTNSDHQLHCIDVASLHSDDNTGTISPIGCTSNTTTTEGDDNAGRILIRSSTSATSITTASEPISLTSSISISPISAILSSPPTSSSLLSSSASSCAILSSRSRNIIPVSSASSFLRDSFAAHSASGELLLRREICVRNDCEHTNENEREMILRVIDNSFDRLLRSLQTESYPN